MKRQKNMKRKKGVSKVNNITKIKIKYLYINICVYF